jgi:transcriptional regulator with XRE-family HTH domain
MLTTAMRTTGQKLRGLRYTAGLTQSQLAEKAGVAQSTVAQIERGTRPQPHPETVSKLAEALEVTALDILGDDLIGTEE